MTNTGTPVTKGDKITAEKINKKLETIAEGGYISLSNTLYEFNTVYQNTSARPIMLFLPINLYVYAANDAVYTELCVGATADPSTVIDTASIFITQSETGIGATLKGIVLPGWYWIVEKFTDGNGAAYTSPYWRKIEL